MKHFRDTLNMQKEKSHVGIQVSDFKARFSSEHYDTHLMRRKEKHQTAAHQVHIQ